MRKSIIKITGVILMFVFLAGVAPKEYMHELFFDHHDTNEAPLKKDEVVIGNKHLHCSFLHFEFAPFIATDKQVLKVPDIVYEMAYLLPFYIYYYSDSSSNIRLRGPPHIYLSVC